MVAEICIYTKYLYSLYMYRRILVIYVSHLQNFLRNYCQWILTSASCFSDLSFSRTNDDFYGTTFLLRKNNWFCGRVPICIYLLCFSTLYPYLLPTESCAAMLNVFKCAKRWRCVYWVFFSQVIVRIPST